MNRAVRAYARVLGLYPRPFRDEYREDMVALLVAQLRDEPPARVWTRAGTDLLRTLPLRHLEAHMHVDARTVPVLGGIVGALATLALVVGGPAGVFLGIGLAAFAFALFVWRGERPVAPPAPAGRRAALFLVGGAALVTVAVVWANNLGDGQWTAMMGTLFVGFVCAGIGLLLGVQHVARNLRRPA